jgi:hypothetical protein
MAGRGIGRPGVTGPMPTGVAKRARPRPDRWLAGPGRGRTPRIMRWLGLALVGFWALPLWGSALSERVRMPPTAPGMDGSGVRAEMTAAPLPSPFWPRGGPPDPSAPYGRDEARPRGNTPEGTEFADWVVSTDPQRRYVLDAFVRDNRILGVMVNSHLTRGQVQQMLTSLLSAMQRAFPDRMLEVIAYYRSGDQLARLRWDPQTGQARTVWRR